jgi:hypothetical protein
MTAVAKIRTRVIGYWMGADFDYIPPQEVRGNVPVAVRKAICSHLEAGELYKTYRGFSWCRFECGVQSLGHREYTDGYWVWPEGLVHYVRIHGIILPDEFVEHVMARRPYRRESEWDRPPDLTFWKEWCEAHKSEELRERMRAERIHNEEEAAKRIAADIAEREKLQGLSEKRCLFVGCSRRALAGMDLCAACLRGVKPEKAALMFGRLER